MKWFSQWRPLVRVLAFAKPHWRLILLAMIAMAIASGWEAGFVYLMKPFVKAFAEWKHTGRAVGADMVSPAGPVGEAAFALRPGEISDAIAARDGFHLLRLVEIRPGRNKSFEAEKEPLRAEMRALRRPAAPPQAEIGDDAVRAEFERRYGPKARVKQMVFGTRDEARQALNDLKAGRDFDELATARARASAAGDKDAQMTRKLLYRIGWSALLLAPVIGFASFTQHYMRGRVQYLLVADLRNGICGALMPQSLSFFEGRRSGDLMSRITNDVARAQGVFGIMFGGLPEQLCMLAAGVTMSAIASWQLLLISAVITPLVVFPVGYLARIIRRYGRQGLERLADLTDLMSQMFSGIRVIKAFKMEDAEVAEFERTNDKYLRKMTKMVTARGWSHGVIELVVRAFIGLGLLLATWFIVTGRGDLTMDRLYIFMGGIYFSFAALRNLVKEYNNLQEQIPAAERIFELLSHVPTLQDAPDAAALPKMQKGIAFKDVTFAYNAEPVLRNVSFEVRRGETVAVVGRSGAGKSTLVALIPRFYEVSAGAVEIDGLDVRRIRRENLLDHVAIVAQQTFLFNRSIAENIRYGRRDASDEEIGQAARMANIHDFIMTLPEQYKTLCGEFGGKLSGGQRQRIAIARAILKNADILILDEAMAGLDAESETLVQEALANLMKGRTTFVISHDLPTIQKADKILVLRDGQLLAAGRHEELVAQEGEYKTLYAMQFAAFGSPQPER